MRWVGHSKGWDLVVGHCIERWHDHQQTSLVHSSSWVVSSMQDLKEMRDKRDRFKQSYQQAADERDRLAAEVVQLQRRLVELDSNSHKKDLSALRMVSVLAVSGAGGPGV